MFYTVYQITNTITNKIYIGQHQTKNLDDGYMGSGKLLLRAIQKYGIENFTKQILYIFEDEQSMNSKEKELVNEAFCARADTYNICPGGFGGFGYLNKNNLNNANKDKEKIGSKISSSLTGRKRQDISESLKTQYEDGRRKCVLTPQYGNKHRCKKVRCEATGKVYSSIKEAAADKNVTPTCVYKWIKKGKYKLLTDV